MKKMNNYFESLTAMGSKLLMFGSTLMLMMVTIAGFSQTAYITHDYIDSVSAVDLMTSKVIATIKVGKNPKAVAPTPDGKKVYITNSEDNSVSVINTADNTVCATIPVDNYPFGIAISPDGAKVYVGNEKDETIKIISTATDKVIDRIPIGTEPQGLTMSHDGSKLYISDNFSSVVVLNTSNNKIIATIKVGREPDGMALSPDGKTLYVTNFADETVSIVNTISNSVTGLVKVDANPFCICVRPDGKYVYVSNLNGNTVDVIDAFTNTISSTIEFTRNPEGVSMSQDGSKLYVACSGSPTGLYVINTSTNEIIETIPVNTNNVCSYGNFISFTPLAATTGIESKIIEPATAYIYPNPNNGIFNIKQSGNKNFELEIFDVAGRKVFHQLIDNSIETTINFTESSKGVYFYHLINENETLRGKFVKE